MFRFDFIAILVGRLVSEAERFGGAAQNGVEAEAADGTFRSCRSPSPLKAQICQQRIRRIAIFERPDPGRC